MAKGKGNGAGRETKMTPEVVKKIEDAFMVDANVSEACLYAEISRETYYNYLEKHPEFNDRVESIKGMTGLKAKMNIRNEIDNGKIGVSTWHLERRDPDYKPKSKVESEINISAQDSLILALAERRKVNEGKE